MHMREIMAIRRRSVSWLMLALWMLGMLVVLAWAAPFLWMVSTSLKLPGEVMTRHIEWIPRHITWENYDKVLEKPVGRWLTNSL
ncbi:MAG: ABC transporter permease, partial [Nitrospiraceae bacterium]